MMKERIRTLTKLSLVWSGVLLLSTLSLHGMHVTIVTLADGSLCAIKDRANCVSSRDNLDGADGTATVIEFSNGTLGYDGARLGTAKGQVAENSQAHEIDEINGVTIDTSRDCVTEETSFRRPLLIGAGIFALGMAYWFRYDILTLLGLKIRVTGERESFLQDNLSEDHSVGTQVDVCVMDVAHEFV